MIFIQKGDVPLSPRQAVKRGLRHFESEKAQWEREQGIVTDDPEYIAWAAQWVSDNQINTANNLFNHQLAVYRTAVSRLAQYRLADGRPEATEEIETGEYDDFGELVTKTVVVATAIEPLPATIDVPVYDEVSGELTGTDTVSNPEIVQDDIERITAQATIDAIPAEIKTFEQPV